MTELTPFEYLLIFACGLMVLLLILSFSPRPPKYRFVDIIPIDPALCEQIPVGIHILDEDETTIYVETEADEEGKERIRASVLNRTGKAVCFISEEQFFNNKTT